jgi:plastocyanin
MEVELRLPQWNKPSQWPLHQRLPQHTTYVQAKHISNTFTNFPKVVVGGTAGLVYTPDTIQAAVGDMVIFTFMNANHTVTQSAFTAPCVKLPEGMDSGFMPNTNNTIVPAPQMAMQVTVATPICKWPFLRY